MLAADKIQVPVPVFRNVPVPLITPDAVASPVPPNIPAVVKVIAPDAVAAVAALFTNEPLKVIGFDNVYPFKSNRAPEAIVVDDVLPNASLFPILKVPTLTVVLPLYVLIPDKVQVPVPVLENVPDPLTTPLAVALPVPLNIAAVDNEIFPEAVDAVPLVFTNDPLNVNGSAVAKPLKSTEAPDAMVVVPLVVPRASLLPNLIVPAFTLVFPL